MAGNHKSCDTGSGTRQLFIDGVAARRRAFPGTRVDRAYAEGRAAAEAGASAGTNPHSALSPAFGSREFVAWAAGHATRTNASGTLTGFQYQTATEDA